MACRASVVITHMCPDSSGIAALPWVVVASLAAPGCCAGPTFVTHGLPEADEALDGRECDRTNRNGCKPYRTFRLPSPACGLRDGGAVKRRLQACSHLSC